jgi:hypothetical protein
VVDLHDLRGIDVVDREIAFITAAKAYITSLAEEGLSQALNTAVSQWIVCEKWGMICNTM